MIERDLAATRIKALFSSTGDLTQLNKNDDHRNSDKRGHSHGDSGLPRYLLCSGHCPERLSGKSLISAWAHNEPLRTLCADSEPVEALQSLAKGIPLDPLPPQTNRGMPIESWQTSSLVTIHTYTSPSLAVYADVGFHDK